VELIKQFVKVSTGVYTAARQAAKRYTIVRQEED
jgi:hypothetical protein